MKKQQMADSLQYCLERIGELEMAVKQLECKHEKFYEYRRQSDISYVDGFFYAKTCEKCDKVFRIEKEEYFEWRAQEIIKMKDQLAWELKNEGN